MIRMKRAYEDPSPDDGFRVLVERLWPRGVTKERAALDLWLKDIAPSPDLRQWYAHQVEKWPGFRERYWAEIERKQDQLTVLREKAATGTVTLVYAARDQEHNSALVLKEFLEQHSG